VATHHENGLPLARKSMAVVSRASVLSAKPSFNTRLTCHQSKTRTSMYFDIGFKTRIISDSSLANFGNGIGILPKIFKVHLFWTRSSASVSVKGVTNFTGVVGKVPPVGSFLSGDVEQALNK
jgi:hypothetical protein